MVSKYPGKCGACLEKFPVGTKILWEKGSAPRHVSCNALIDGLLAKDVKGYSRNLTSTLASELSPWEGHTTSRENADYNAGVADANRYMSDKAIYGAELAEQWDIEADLKNGDY